MKGGSGHRVLALPTSVTRQGDRSLRAQIVPLAPVTPLIISGPASIDVATPFGHRLVVFAAIAGVVRPGRCVGLPVRRIVVVFVIARSPSGGMVAPALGVAGVALLDVVELGSVEPADRFPIASDGFGGHRRVARIIGKGGRRAGQCDHRSRQMKLSRNSHCTRTPSTPIAGCDGYGARMQSGCDERFADQPPGAAGSAGHFAASPFQQ